MRRMLEYQADRIEAVLAQHRIPARVTGGTVTPRWIRYDVLPAIGTRIRALTSLAEELAAALGAPSVRIARQGALIAVEGPREDSRPVRLLPPPRPAQRPPRHRPPGHRRRRRPPSHPPPSPNVAHILVAGTTGSGKTALLRAMALSLAYFNPPHALRMAPMDPKGAPSGSLEPLPHLARPVITDPDEAAEALQSLVRLMEMQSRQGNREAGERGTPLSSSSLPICLLLIDELADLMLVGGERVERPLTRLLQRGREAGIHVVAATQKPTAAVIGSLIKANFPVRLVGKVASPEDARVASGWKGTGAERLMGKGDFIAVAEGKLHRFQAAYAAPEEVPALVAEIGNRRIGEPNERAARAPARSAPKPMQPIPTMR